MRLAPLALALLALGCITDIDDPNRWSGPRSTVDFLTDSEVCRDQASHPLQPDMPNADEMDREVYRRCMQSYGWRER